MDRVCQARADSHKPTTWTPSCERHPKSAATELHLIFTRLLHLPDAADSNQLQTVTDTLVDHGATPTGQWHMRQYLFRAIPNPAEESDGNHIQHIISMSHLPDRAFVCIARPVPPDAGSDAKPHTFMVDPSYIHSAAIIIPPSQMDSYATLVRRKFGLLWTPGPRTEIINGMTWQLDDFTIRVGELRQFGRTQGQESDRGLLVQISMQMPVDENSELPPRSMFGAGTEKLSRESIAERHAAVASLEEFWNSFGIPGGRKTCGVSIDSRGLEEVRIICNALQLKN